MKKRETVYLLLDGGCDGTALRAYFSQGSTFVPAGEREQD